MRLSAISARSAASGVSRQAVNWSGLLPALRLISARAPCVRQITSGSSPTIE
jgi:hypothetical protein